VPVAAITLPTFISATAVYLAGFLVGTWLVAAWLKLVAKVVGCSAIEYRTAFRAAFLANLLIAGCAALSPACFTLAQRFAGGFLVEETKVNGSYLALSEERRLPGKFLYEAFFQGLPVLVLSIAFALLVTTSLLRARFRREDGAPPGLWESFSAAACYQVLAFPFLVLPGLIVWLAVRG
jgi:hypothetical protein